METARRYSPGGVHSGIRAFVPLVFERAEGAYVWDVDGNQLHRLSQRLCGD